MRESLIISVVRGENPWSVLRPYGVVRGECGWSFPKLDDPVCVTLKDLEIGLKSYSTCPDGRTEWAQFILAASGLIEFDSVGAGDGWEEMLSQLWDLAFSEDG